jgi:hypothetical protein
MTHIHQQGEREAKGPGEVSWVAYDLNGSLYAACYQAGRLVQRGPSGYYKAGPNGAIPLRLTDLEAIAAVPPPADLPVLPSQYELVSAGWDPPIPLSREATLPAFPVHVLPDWLGDFVTALAKATQTPVDLPGMLSLAALATAAGGRARIEPRSGWSEPANLYLAVGMAPGNCKSPVYAAITGPLWAVDSTMAQESLSGSIEATARKELATNAATVAAREAAAAKGDTADAKMADAIAAAEMAEAITVPVQPRLLADDATVEALGTLMADQGGRMAVLSDEGGVFDLMAGRYSNGQANLDLYLKAWSGTPHRVDRKGRPAEFIPRPALTMGLAVQPDVLRAIATRPGFRRRGLLARFLYSLPASPLGRRAIDPPAVPESVGALYRDNLSALVRSLAEWTDQAALTPSRSAIALLHDYQLELEPRLGPDGDLDHIADWASKLVGQLVPVAGLIHLATHLPDGYRKNIDGSTMAAAIEVGHYLIPHALAVFELMADDLLTEHATYVLGWLAAHDRERFIARDLYTANRHRFPSATELTPVLAHLETLGWIRQERQPRPAGRGRPPSSIWAVHPQNHQRNQRKPDSADSADGLTPFLAASPDTEQDR